MKKKGSWDNNTWYNPQGKFDWSALDRFEISVEDAGTFGEQIWFDNIQITDLDTAEVRESGAVGFEETNDQPLLNLEVMPNPVVYSANITFTLPAESHVNLSIYTITGIKIRTLSDDTMGPGEHSLTWDGVSDNGVPLRQGFYICVLKASNLQSSCKIIKY